jgi:hypothetical protein
MASIAVKPNHLAGWTYSQDPAAIVIVTAEVEIVHRCTARQAFPELLAALDAADAIQVPEKTGSQDA